MEHIRFYIVKNRQSQFLEGERKFRDHLFAKLASIAENRKQSGIHVYHLNIGQPDLPTPTAVFEAIHSFLNLQLLMLHPMVCQVR